MGWDVWGERSTAPGPPIGSGFILATPSRAAAEKDLPFGRRVTRSRWENEAGSELVSQSENQTWPSGKA